MRLHLKRSCLTLKTSLLLIIVAHLINNFNNLQSHYSITKGAHWIGLGTENLVIVPSDDDGQMIPSELEFEIRKAIEENKVPFFVNATAGTTVLGAYDPLEPLAEICKKYGVWLHVDVRAVV